MPSFEIQSELKKHEVRNAVVQANWEVAIRFDFKESSATYKYEGNSITLQAETDFQLKQMIDILQNKFAKRQIDVAHMKLESPIIQHKSAQQTVTLFEGIDQTAAKKIIKLIKFRLCHHVHGGNPGEPSVHYAYVPACAHRLQLMRAS